MNKHEHDYKTIKLARITKIDNTKYNGSAGDRAFLFRMCECGKGKAFEYGKFKAMQQLLSKLKHETAR